MALPTLSLEFLSNAFWGSTLGKEIQQQRESERMETRRAAQAELESIDAQEQRDVTAALKTLRAKEAKEKTDRETLKKSTEAKWRAKSELNSIIARAKIARREHEQLLVDTAGPEVSEPIATARAERDRMTGEGSARLYRSETELVSVGYAVQERFVRDNQEQLRSRAEFVTAYLRTAEIASKTKADPRAELESLWSQLPSIELPPKTMLEKAVELIGN